MAPITAAKEKLMRPTELGQRPAHGTEVAGWVGEAWNRAETESRNTHGCFSPDR